MGLAHAAGMLAVAGLPFALSAGAALVGGLIRRQRHHTLQTTAGEWLATTAGRVAGLRVGVSPELVSDADGYWPHVRTITLSRSTWCGVDADAHAIAAHELGHALEHVERPLLASRLALARRSHAPAVQTFAASALVGALYGLPSMWTVALVALVWATLAAAAVAVEEALATRHALSLVAQSTWSGANQRRARLALFSAWCVYGIEAVVRLGLLIAWPWVGRALLQANPVSVTIDPAWLGWAVFFMLPVLALHAGATLLGAVRPPDANSEFRLAWTAQREATWEFHAALVILLWASLAALHPASRPLAPLVVLAAIPAMGPLAHLTRGMALVPVIAIWAMGAHLGLWGAAQPPTRGRPPKPVPATDLAVQPTDTLGRVGTLLRVAYLPLATAWIIGFIG